MTFVRKPVSFIATDDPQAASAFYCHVLGLDIVESSAFALVFLDGDHTLRVQIVPELVPAPHTAYGWQVPDIAQALRVLAANGVKASLFDRLKQDELGVWTSPDGHKIAWFTDPSGNVLSLTEHKT